MSKILKSFRVHPEIWQQVELAVERDGITSTQFILEAILEKLDGNSVSQILDELVAMRRDQIAATKALLILVGSKAELSKSEATSWVENNLSTRRLH